ncbi:hypothetical protein OG389_19920 [Streptomyces sp. NBC_00435]|uniref:hypothetical protein n=1 Tax=Streptomyces sp. NBC_00435 TaxID=2903649 RepID=UPI002E1E893A
MHRITRYTIPAALCLTLLTVSPGLASATAESGKPQAAAAAPAGKAIPGTEALLAQVQSLAAVGGVLRPVTDLLAAVLKSPDGKVPEADLAALKEKVDAALAELKKGLPATPALPVPVPPVDAPKLPVETPKLPVETPKLPVEAPKLPLEAPKLPVALPVAARKAAGGPLDLATGAIDKLKSSVDGLHKAAGPCGCSTDAKAKATDVLTDLVAALVALLTGLGLPGLPTLPVPDLPVPELPVPAPALPVE